MRNRTRIIIFATILAAGAIGAAKASAAIVELGASPGQTLPDASCSDPKQCWVVPRTTGYQIQTGNVKNPFRVMRRGRIFALTLSLPTPSDSQIGFFNDKYGGAAAVRVAVLRPKRRKHHPRRYVLAGQSEVIKIASYFGSKPTIPLARTVFVKKGDVVALTATTWTPSFLINLDKTFSWRSSRSAKKCNDVDRPALQDRIGLIRNYNCQYPTGRLLYSVSELTAPSRTHK